MRVVSKLLQHYIFKIQGLGGNKKKQKVKDNPPVSVHNVNLAQREVAHPSVRAQSWQCKQAKGGNPKNKMEIFNGIFHEGGGGRFEFH